MDDISPDISILSLYHMYDGEAASVFAVRVVVTQALSVPVIVAVGNGFIETVEKEEDWKQEVIPSVTITLYGPAVVTYSVEDISPPKIEKSLYHTYDGDAASVTAVRVVDSQAERVPVINAVGVEFTVTSSTFDSAAPVQSPMQVTLASLLYQVVCVRSPAS